MSVHKCLKCIACLTLLIITVYIDIIRSIEELSCIKIHIELRDHICPNSTSWDQKLFNTSRILIAFADVSRKEDTIAYCNKNIFTAH